MRLKCHPHRSHPHPPPHHQDGRNDHLRPRCVPDSNDRRPFTLSSSSPTFISFSLRRFSLAWHWRSPSWWRARGFKVFSFSETQSFYSASLSQLPQPSHLLFNAQTTNYLTSPISDQTQPAKTRSTLPLHPRTFLQRLPQYCTAILMALVGSKYLPLRPTIHFDFGWLPKLITQRVQCISLHKSICFSF